MLRKPTPMRNRLLLVSFFALIPAARCVAQASTKETVDTINRVRANDAANSSGANHPIGMSQAEIDELARKLVAGFPSRPKNLPPEPSEQELARRHREYLDAVAFTKRVEAGEPEANLEKGKEICAGNRFPHLIRPVALKMFLVAAPVSNEALFLAASMIYRGDGTPADEGSARQMLGVAAAGGYGPAKEFLASHPHMEPTEQFPSILTRLPVIEPDGPQKKPRDKSKYFQKAYAIIEGKEKKPDAGEYLVVARLYRDGIGVPRDTRKMRDFAENAGHGEDYIQTERHGYLMEYAELHRADDPAALAAEADAYAEAGGGQHAQFEQAVAANMRKDYKSERFYLWEAGSQRPYDNNNEFMRRAMLELGLMQLSGLGGPVDEGSGTYNISNAGIPEAQYWTGHFRANGSHGLKVNRDAARSWLEAAAKGEQKDAAREVAQLSNSAGAAGLK